MVFHISELRPRIYVPAVERIVLMGGPCSGQIHDLDEDVAEVTARDADGREHVYVRTDAVDVEDDLRVIVYRLAAPDE